jgi:hypothetical protein
LFRRVPDPSVCADCHYIVVRHGVVTDLALEGGRLSGISISGGSIHQLDAAGREVTLTIANSYSAQQPDSFSQLSAAAGSAVTQSGLIRGVVVDGDRLRSVIASDSEVSMEPARTPYIRLTSADMRGGVVRVDSGGTVTVHGEDFAASSGADALVRIFVGNESAAQNVVVGSDGTFRAEVAVRQLPGQHELVVEQQQGRRFTRVKGHVQVVIVDRPR